METDALSQRPMVSQQGKFVPQNSDATKLLSLHQDLQDEKNTALTLLNPPKRDVNTYIVRKLNAVQIHR